VCCFREQVFYCHTGFIYIKDLWNGRQERPYLKIPKYKKGWFNFPDYFNTLTQSIDKKYLLTSDYLLDARTKKKLLKPCEFVNKFSSRGVINFATNSTFTDIVQEN
jgi:hypothetical protein